MTTYDGPTLRSGRESAGMPLRRVARQAGMSHGHLSKVERGEYGRPVTPAVMAAYEKVTGLKLADAVPTTQPGKRPDGHGNKAVWRPGQMSKPRRRGYNAAIAALTVGGHLGEPLLRLLDSTGRPVTPALPEGTDVAQLAQLTTLATTLDLRYGGRLAAQHAKALLRWAVPILDATGLDEQMNRRLHAAVARLAHRAAWAAFDTDAHDAARSLFRLAAYTATLAGDPDLRAHVVADVAAQHNHLGYHDAALEVIRFVEGDERINPLVQVVLHLVKARTFAALGDREGCYRCIKLAEQHHDDIDLCPGPDGGWLVSLCHPGLLHAGIGHALAGLAYTLPQ